MSRVAKKEIIIPTGVNFDVQDNVITVSNGDKKLQQPLCSTVELLSENGKLTFAPSSKAVNSSWAMAGTIRALVANMIQGVTEGFKLQLQLVGVGYRAKQEGRKIVFTLGKSHPDIYHLPDLVDVVIEKDVMLTLSSINKQLLGQVAAEIAALRKPDAYKGKGVRRVGVSLKLKEVKK